MKKTFILSLLLMILGSGVAFSQEIGLDAKSPDPLPMSKQQKNADKKKEKQRAKIEKSEAKARKAHYKLQTREVKKRMKKSKREANRINSNKKEFFLKRWFQKSR